MTRIELVNLILTKDALYRLSYISVANEEYSIRKLDVWQDLLTKNQKFFSESPFNALLPIDKEGENQFFDLILTKAHGAQIKMAFCVLKIETLAYSLKLMIDGNIMRI